MLALSRWVAEVPSPMPRVSPYRIELTRTEREELDCRSRCDQDPSASARLQRQPVLGKRGSRR